MRAHAWILLFVFVGRVHRRLSAPTVRLPNGRLDK